MSHTWESLGKYVLLTEAACQENDFKEGAITIVLKNWMKEEDKEFFSPPGSTVHITNLLLEEVPSDPSWVRVPYSKILFSSGNNFLEFTFFVTCLSGVRFSYCVYLCNRSPWPCFEEEK